MTNNNSLSTRIAATICAALFSSIMVLSAVGPAQAGAATPLLAMTQGSNATTMPAAYMA